MSILGELPEWLVGRRSTGLLLAVLVVTSPRQTQCQQQPAPLAHVALIPLVAGLLAVPAEGRQQLAPLARRQPATTKWVDLAAAAVRPSLLLLLPEVTAARRVAHRAVAGHP